MKNFGNKIKKLLKNNDYYYRVRVYPKKEEVLNRKGKKVTQTYEKVVIYAGWHIEKLAQKRSKRLIAWKNPDGQWEGDLETLKQFGNRDSDGEYIGSSLYVRDYHDKSEPLKKVLFSDLWEEDEKKYGKGIQERELLKIMENWRFQEIERGKLEIQEQKARVREAEEERIQKINAKQIM